jgi:DNA-binding NtrC family response regulator
VIARVSRRAFQETTMQSVPLLAGHFLSKFSPKIEKSIQGFEQEAVKALQGYHFPGNVRELENIIERAIIFAKSDMITLQDLGLTSPTSKPYVRKGTLSEMQKYAIIEALRRWEGNRTRAAEELGINRKTLLNKIKEYGLKDIWQTERIFARQRIRIPGVYPPPLSS